MANFILRKAEPKDVTDILRLIKVINSVLNLTDAVLIQDTDDKDVFVSSNVMLRSEEFQY